MESERDRVARLTEGEARVLRAFIRHSDPKILAQELKLSANTVRDYLKAARRTLQVGRSIDAAHMLARVEGQAISARDLDPQSVSLPVEEVVGPTLPEASDVLSESGWGTLLLPFPRKGRPWNDHSVWVRVIQIAIGLFCLLTAAALAVSVGEAVSRIARRML